MKRFWTVLLVVAVALVMALPAGAVKPPKPPKPPTSVPIAVFMDAEPVWAHEGSDLLRYIVTLENKTGSEISGVALAFTHSIFLSEPVSIGTLPANGSETVSF